MLTDLLHRLRAIFKRSSVEAELSDELRFHLEQQAQKYIDAGLTPDEAMRRARLALGGFEQVQEECRQARGISALETTAQDIRYAARMLRKSPGFTAVVALSLALGIGANTAIFSLIDAVMLRMLPVREPEKLFLIGSTANGQTWYGLTYSQYRLLRDRNQALTELAAYSPVRLNLSIDGHTEPAAEGQMVSGNYFPVLGVSPVAGRAIGIEDDQAPNAHPVAMISYGYWERRFGLDRATIGRTIHLSGVSFTIIGVTPPEFFGLEVGTAPDIFVPVMMQPTVMPAFENLLDNPMIMRTWLKPLGRLKAGISIPKAASELTALYLQSAEFANLGRGGKQPLFGKPRLVLSSAARGLSDLRQQFSQSLQILMTVVGVVLLIACANTANLLLARAAARRSEFAMRLALGASRFRLMRQLLVESVLLAMLGGVLGIALARWGTTLLLKFMSSGRTPIVVDLNLDLRMLGFTATVAILTGILFGFAPALRASRIDLTPALKGQRGAINSGSGSLGPGKVLAVAQVALSLLLLVGAGLFVRSLQNLDGQDAGFDRDSVLIVRVEPKLSDQRNLPGVPMKLDRIYQDLLQRVETIPVCVRRVWRTLPQPPGSTSDRM